MTDSLLAHAPFLRGLSYRMTGSVADADDIVQETFVRALERPPARTDEPLRPWLTRVAMNLARDRLRRRRREPYVGPWLPTVLDTGEEALPSFELADADGVTTEGRYDRLESVSLAFLVALEALTPRQRAVLLLRDVLDYSVRETAEALAMTEGAVKVAHHRARAAMGGYDGARRGPREVRSARVREALERFVQALSGQNVEQVAALLTEDVVSLSDGGGEFLAARVPVSGREKVAQLYARLTALRGAPTHASVRSLNGLPALFVELPRQKQTDAPRVVLGLDVDERGAIRAVYSVMASAKLGGLRGS